ncbi:MAG: BlaR1 peptidase M56, partial [Lutibacter sp.]
MINYIIQMLLFQTLFLAVYDLFLQKETFFKWNRIYLLATPILSFVIPLLKLESFRKTVPQDYMVY